MSLEDIKARAESATPGPWFREYGDVITSKEDVRLSEQDANGNGPSLRICEKAPHLDRRDRQGINNATFIAHARTDVPKLVAALEAVQSFHRERYEPAFITTTCDYDGNEWPCEVVQAIEKALSE